MSFEEWYDTHYGTEEEKERATASAATAEFDPNRLDYSPTGDDVERAVGSVFQSVRDAPGWVGKRIWKGATRTDIPPDVPLPRGMTTPNLAGMAAIDPNWSFQRAVENFPNQIPELYNQVKQQILPPGFSAQRGWENITNTVSPIINELSNEIRQVVLPDESIEAIKKDPYSINSMEAYLNAAINLSGGGKGVPRGPRPVPRRVWEMWNPSDHPGIKVDELGNHYEATGTHYDKNTGESHIVVKPVEPTLTPKAGPTPYPKGYTGISPKEPPTTWEQLSSWQKQWFENQWKLGNTPSMKDVPQEGTGFGSGLMKAEDWQDNPFQKFLEGTMPAEELKPPPEKGDIWDEWAKKHGGQKPDFGPPEELPPVPPPYQSQHPVTPEDLADIGYGPTGPMPPDKPPGYWGNVNDRKYSGPLAGQTWADIYATPDVEFTAGPPKEPTLKDIYDDLKANPEKSDFWDTLPGPKYIEGRGMAMPYSDEGTPLMPKTPEQKITEAQEGIQSDLRKIAEWEKALNDGDITKQQYYDAMDAIREGKMPPLPPSKPNPVPDWWKPPDEGTVSDFQNIEDWFKKQQFLKNRFKWKPPDHGNL